MKYAEKYGVSRASRKYNKSRSYIYFWKQRCDGSVASLACQSRRPHSHPNQHTEDDLELIRDIRRAITARSSAATVRIRSAFTPLTPFILWMTSQSNSPSAIVVLTTCL